MLLLRHKNFVLLQKMEAIADDRYYALLQEASDVLKEKTSTTVEFSAEEEDIKKRYMWLLKRASIFLHVRNALRPQKTKAKKLKKDKVSL
jgi:hypothetical protein